jgi:hypothetical protein
VVLDREGDKRAPLHFFQAVPQHPESTEWQSEFHVYPDRVQCKVTLKAECSAQSLPVVLSPITPYMVVETFPMLFIDNLSPLDIPPLPPLPRY